MDVVRKILLSTGLILATSSAYAEPPTFQVGRGQNSVELSDEVRRFESKQITLYVGDEQLSFTLRDLGFSLRSDDMRSLIRAAKKNDASKPINIALPISVDVDRALQTLWPLKSRFDRKSNERRYDAKSQTLTPAAAGRSVDLWSTVEAIETAIRRGQNSAKAVVVHTGIEDTLKWEKTKVTTDATIAEFKTLYVARDKDRTHNLRVAAKHIDGMILLPGESFDFNKVVGERNEARGFRPAPVIAGGELVDGLGGGACQIAGTLHAAAFFAGLEIDERHPHSRPSSYIKLGLDAAVSYPKLNLRFKNTSATPLVIRIEVKNGVTHAKLLGKSRDHEVRFTRHIRSFKPFGEREISDSKLPEGARVLVQRGVPGFRVQRYRNTTQISSNQSVREQWEDIYPPTTQIWRVGSGPVNPDFELPLGDQHKEYVADEYTTVIWEVDAKKLKTIRKAGKTGYYGWMVKEGMPPATTNEPAETAAKP